MKKLVLLSLVAFATLFNSKISAQQKIGHLNYQEIIQLLPEYKAAETELEAYQLGLENDLKELENQAMKLQQQMEEEQKKASPSKTRVQVLNNKYMQLQEQYAELQQSAKDDLNNKMTELMEPLKQKVTDAVNEVAKENGFTYIMDNSYGTLIYADPQFDIKELVKAKLNIKDKPVSNPKSGKPMTKPGMKK